MATRKPTPLAADLIARKGEAAAAMAPTTTSTTASSEPYGTKGTVSPTARLDPERYHRLVAYAARFVLRKTYQDILVEALDVYLDQMAE
jgi:hypothetical protein